MDIATLKLKLMNMITASDARLSPRTTHVLGNWHIQSWELKFPDFPIVTVRVQGKQVSVWSFKPPTVAHGEIYSYSFTAHVFAETMEISREIMDNILDYLAIHNKQADTKIIDIINLTSRESVLQKGPRRYWRMILTGTILTEEPVS